MSCTFKSFQSFFTLIKVDCSFAGYVSCALINAALDPISRKSSVLCNIGNLQTWDWFATSRTELTQNNELTDGGGPTGALATIDFLYRQRSAY